MRLGGLLDAETHCVEFGDGLPCVLIQEEHAPNIFPEAGLLFDDDRQGHLLVVGQPVPRSSYLYLCEGVADPQPDTPGWLRRTSERALVQQLAPERTQRSRRCTS
jgi:hypothetical protein